MEKVIEIIEKYLNGKLYEKDYISRLKSEYRKRDFTVAELRDVMTFLKTKNNRRAIDLYIMLFIDNNFGSIKYEMIDDFLKEFKLSLNRYLIIQFISKGFINKDNKDKIAIEDEMNGNNNAINKEIKSIKDLRVNKYYTVIKDDYPIDYSSRLDKYINIDYHNFNSVDVLDEFEELAMIRDYRIKRNDDALKCLCIYNYKLVSKVLYELKVPYIASASDYDFYFNEGVWGLITAIDRYNLTSGVRLSTYAYSYIKNSIRNVLTNDRPIQLPTDVLQSPNAISRFDEETKQKFLNANQPVISLDDAISNSDDSEDIYNFVSNDNSNGSKQPYDCQVNNDDVASNVTNDLDNKLLLEVLRTSLSGKDFNLIYNYYYKKERLIDIAAREEVTFKAISQRIKRVLKKLKKIPELKEFASASISIEAEKNEEVVTEVKTTTDEREEDEISNFDVRANARAHLIREFCATYLVEYPDGTVTVTKDENGKENTEENMKADVFIKHERSERNFNIRVYDEIGRKSYTINLIGGFPFICVEDIDRELRRVDRALSPNKPKIHDYMSIDNIFYLKIADVVRKDDEKSLDALISLGSTAYSKNYNIYSHVRFLANHYYERPAKDAEIAELLKEVFMTFIGDVPMTTHLKNIVKEKHQEIAKKVVIAEEKQKTEGKRKALNLY